LRITGGNLRGFKLNHQVSSVIRPTTDRVREALFNILENSFDWAETNFLDLFSGSGIISLEVLSRGGKKVFSIDNSQKAINNLKNVSKSLRFKNHEFKVGNIPACLTGLSNLRFDIIFADPPYNWSDYNGLLDACALYLSDNGIVILEHDSNIKPQVEILKKYDDRKYGQSTLSFYKNEE
jgi:16S rRNA (guanine966-N2)-methyltransferase